MGPTKKSRDFLDKELFVKRNIVTFRSLSRELGIHVNNAKKELQLYYDAVRETNASAVPTYFVSGEVPLLKVSPRLEIQLEHSDSAMDLDLAFEEDQEEVDEVHQTRILLVDARSLDEATSQFSRIHSVHIYSLSPSRFGDAGLVCIPSPKVRKVDAQGGLASFSVSGKITGSHVKLKSGIVDHRGASSSKTTLGVPAKVALKAVTSAGEEQQTTKGKTPSTVSKEPVSRMTTLRKTESQDKPKQSGKLDWSKAKTKETEPIAGKTKEGKMPKPEPNSVTASKNSPASKKPAEPLAVKSEPAGFASVDARKRGVKRKPHIDADQESEPEPFPMKVESTNITSSSGKKEVIYSDEDDDGEVRMLGLRRPKRKSIMTSDSEMSLQAMMDIDDELVDRVSRVSKSRPQPEEEEESESEPEPEPEKEATAPPATSEDEESDYAPIIPKKRKARKVLPVGRNGLRKRRVVKSRTTTDAKGYMQTEDYSSYESVDEEEVETKPKGKGKETKKVAEPKAEAKPKVVAKEESAGKLKVKSVPKPRGGAMKRGGLLNFFGPERSKK